MIPLRKTLAAAAAVAILSIGGIASAALPPSPSSAQDLATTVPTTATLVVAANEDPKEGHHYSKEEFDRQSAVLAPKEGDNTRFYIFGALGVVLIILLGLVVVNRKKWGGPTAQ